MKPEQEQAAFEAYEDVRTEGLYNMLDPRAQAASGLDRDDYMYVIKHYGELREKYRGGQDTS